jgi:hypothetical protein
LDEALRIAGSQPLHLLIQSDEAQADTPPAPAADPLCWFSKNKPDKFQKLMSKYDGDADAVRAHIVAKRKNGFQCSPEMQAQLSQLEDLGFPQRWRNLHLLKKYGSVDTVVEKLSGPRKGALVAVPTEQEAQLSELAAMGYPNRWRMLHLLQKKGTVEAVLEKLAKKKAKQAERMEKQEARKTEQSERIASREAKKEATKAVQVERAEKQQAKQAERQPAKQACKENNRAQTDDSGEESKCHVYGRPAPGSPTLGYQFSHGPRHGGCKQWKRSQHGFGRHCREDLLPSLEEKTSNLASLVHTFIALNALELGPLPRPIFKVARKLHKALDKATRHCQKIAEVLAANTSSDSFSSDAEA